MSTAANPACRRIFRTPTFVKSLSELKIGPKEADDITHFVATNAQSGTIEHRQMGFVLKRLPWKPQLWVQFLEDDNSNIYLLTMTDEEAGPRPPTKKARLARVLDRLWVAAAVKGAEWLAHVLRGLTQIGHRSPTQRLRDSRFVAVAVSGGLTDNAGTAAPAVEYERFNTAFSSGVHLHQALFLGGIIKESFQLSSNVRPLTSAYSDLVARVSRGDIDATGIAMPTSSEAGRDRNAGDSADQLGLPRISSKDDSNH
jgi:hypothetical protein